MVSETVSLTYDQQALLFAAFTPSQNIKLHLKFVTVIESGFFADGRFWLGLLGLRLMVSEQSSSLIILDCLDSVIVLPLQPLDFSLVLLVSLFNLRVESFYLLLVPQLHPFMSLLYLILVNQEIALYGIHMLAIVVLLLPKLLLVLLTLLLHRLNVLVVLLLQPLLQLLHLLLQLDDLLVELRLLLFIIGEGRRHGLLMLTLIGAFLQLCKRNRIYEI